MRTSTVAALSGLVLSSLAHPYHDLSASEAHAHPLSKRQAADALERFRPQQRAVYVDETGAPSANAVGIASVGGGSPLEAAENHVRSIHPEATFRRADDTHTSSNGITHVYFKQTLNGLDIDDADFNVNVCERSSLVPNLVLTAVTGPLRWHDLLLRRLFLYWSAS